MDANYWCNLLNETAINGQANPARPVAIIGMFVLSFALSSFWILFPKQMETSLKLKNMIQIFGVTSMLISLFLFSNFSHDVIINLVSIFALFAVIGVFIVLYQKNWKTSFYFGCINILLVCLNNYVYYTEGMLIYLPVLQKISFVSFMIWISFIDIQLYKLDK